MYFVAGFPSLDVFPFLFHSPLVPEIQGNFVDQPSNGLIRSLADEVTELPCHYQPDAGVQVVQVTWYKELPDATKEQIITAHQTNGQTGQFSVLE